MSWVLLPFSACLAANSDQLQWFSVSTPGQSAVYRSDAGLVGQDESPSVLVDLCAKGGSYTGIDLSYQTDHATQGNSRWKRPSVDFGLETAVEALPGLVFALDAVDHHPKTVASDGSSKWELFDPQGGLRVGGGFDLLRSSRSKSEWRWVVAGWLPVFSQTREWELRSGLLLARKARLDATAVWSSPGIASRWTVPADTTTPQDTLWWRANQSRFAVRLGASPTPSTSLQAWGGLRRLRDPGIGPEPSWRTWGRTWFAGAQSNFQTGPMDWETEARAEIGSQSVLFDGTSAYSNLPDSAITRSSTDFTTGSGRILSTLDLTKSVGMGLALSGAWIDHENIAASGTPLPPALGPSGVWASTRRLSATLSSSVRLPWATITPEIGVQWLARDGQSAPLWQEGAPFSAGRTWSIPMGLRIVRLGSMNGKIGYGLSGEIRVSGEAALEPGLRHHLEMKQGF
ncbi:MAG: hypothetical protein AAB214_14260 [Fibrobacterota bacterium]